MSIAFGVALGQVQGSGAASRELTSLSVTGTDLIILAAVRTETVTKTVSSINWTEAGGGGAQAFTQLGGYKDAEASNHRVSLWYLVNPTQSPTNSRIVATISANDQMYLAADFYTGVAQSSTFNTADEGGPSTTDPGASTTTSDTTGSWAVGVVISGNSGISFLTGTPRQQISTGGGDGQLLDSNAGVNSGVPFAVTWTGGGSFAWITAMMRPAGAVPATGGNPTAGFMTLMGTGN